MIKYDINRNLIDVFRQLYQKANSVMYYNRSITALFRTTVGVHQSCLLSPTLVNIFLERIMTDALEDHVGTVSIGERIITNLRFADDIGGLVGTKTKLKSLVNYLDNASRAYDMEISSEKTELMTNNIAEDPLTDIYVSDQAIDTVVQFKDLGVIVSVVPQQ